MSFSSLQPKIYPVDNLLVCYKDLRSSVMKVRILILILSQLK